MEKKNDCMRHCRYYRGQVQNPNTDDADMSWFWDMERVYVWHNGEFEGESDYYKRIVGKEYPGIPFDLLMVMFTSWGKQPTTYKKTLVNSTNLWMNIYLSQATISPRTRYLTEYKQQRLHHGKSSLCCV